MLTGLDGTTGPDGIVAPPPPPPPILMSPPVFPLGDGPGPDGILTPPPPPPEALTPLTADDPPLGLDPPFLQYMKQQQHPLSSKKLLKLHSIFFKLTLWLVSSSSHGILQTLAFAGD